MKDHCTAETNHIDVNGVHDLTKVLPVTPWHFTCMGRVIEQRSLPHRRAETTAQNACGLGHPGDAPGASKIHNTLSNLCGLCHACEAPGLVERPAVPPAGHNPSCTDAVEPRAAKHRVDVGDPHAVAKAELLLQR